MEKVRKFMAAVGGAIVVTAAGLGDGALSQGEITAIVAAWGAAFAVYAVKNKAPLPPPPPPQGAPR